MRRVSAFIGLCLVTAFLGCSRKPAMGGKAGEAVPVAVTVEKPRKTTLHWSIEQPGAILPYEQAPIVAKLPGYVSRVYVDIDDRVFGPERDWWGNHLREGTLLAEIAIAELDEEAKQKDAQAVQARAEVELARKNLIVADANVRSAQAMYQEAVFGEKQSKADYERWQSESKRVNGLVKSGTIDKQSAEETRNQFLAAEGMWEKAKAHIVSAEAAEKESKAKRERADVEITTALARQTASEAEARRLMKLREYTQIRAPFDGIVTARYIHTGHFLQPSSATEVRPLFTVSRIDPVRIAIEVPELSAALIEKGKTEAKVRIQAMRGAEFKGIVKRTSWALNMQSRTLRIEIELPNPDATIRPGMYATATVLVELPNATVVPMSAINYLDEDSYCYFVEDGKAVRYQVRIGQNDGELIELLERRKPNSRSGWVAIQGTESVIVKHAAPLTDGQVVSP